MTTAEDQAAYRERRKVYMKAYQSTPEYKEKRKKYNSTYKEKTGGEYLNYISNQSYWKKKVARIKKLGGKCVECGFTDVRALQFDHINGDGFKHRSKSLDHPNHELQILCANCNWIKRSVNGEGKERLYNT